MLHNTAKNSFLIQSYLSTTLLFAGIYTLLYEVKPGNWNGFETVRDKHQSLHLPYIGGRTSLATANGPFTSSSRCCTTPSLSSPPRASVGITSDSEVDSQIHCSLATLCRSTASTYTCSSRSRLASLLLRSYCSRIISDAHRRHLHYNHIRARAVAAQHANAQSRQQATGQQHQRPWPQSRPHGPPLPLPSPAHPQCCRQRLIICWLCDGG